MFSLKGELFKYRWMCSNRNSSRYLLYFDVCVELHGGKYFGADYSKSTALPLQRRETIFLAIAVIGVFGINSGQALPSYRPVSRSSGIDSLSECRFWFRKNTIQPLHKKFKSSHNIKDPYLKISGWFIFQEPFPSYAVFRCEKLRLSPCFLKKKSEMPLRPGLFRVTIKFEFANHSIQFIATPQ
jgi:hypothetical protein